MGKVPCLHGLSFLTPARENKSRGRRMSSASGRSRYLPQPSALREHGTVSHLFHVCFTGHVQSLVCSACFWNKGAKYDKLHMLIAHPAGGPAGFRPQARDQAGCSCLSCPVTVSWRVGSAGGWRVGWVCLLPNHVLPPGHDTCCFRLTACHLEGRWSLFGSN